MIVAVSFALLLQVGGSSAPVIIDRARLDPKADVNFHAIAAPETVYVGDAALYELGVFISEEGRQKLRRNPEFVPAELRSVLAYDLHDTQGGRSVVRDGRSYEVHVFRRALFPVAAGTIVVPPAKLSYAIPLGSSFFSREETRLLHSEPVTIVAIPPPAAGRPANWNGAVGDLRISVNVNVGTTRVGDPFVVTVRVTGEANVHLLPRPALSLGWASVVPSAERVAIDTMAPTVRGTKEFDWLVTPSVEGHEELPAIEYAYFDPAARQYRVARSNAANVNVGEGSLATVDTTVAPVVRTNALPLRSAWSRDLTDAPDRHLWFWALIVIVPIPGVARIARDRPRLRLRSTAKTDLEILAGENDADAPRIRAALHDAMVRRLSVVSLPWTDAAALRRALRLHGIMDGTIAEVMTLLGQLDTAAYGNADVRIPGGAQRAAALYAKIDSEARRSRHAAGASRRAGAAVLLLWLSLGALSAGGVFAAQTTLSSRALFERGLASYATGRAPAAATDFFAAARQEPWAGPAWMNAGTASWVAADTARAVVGWQRALRLNPLDDEPRRFLSLVGADAGAERRDVWPVPRRLPAWFALVLWGAGWYGVWRARRVRIASGALAAATVCLVVSHMHYARLTDPNIVIMASPAPLRALPALGAESGAMPLTGEMFRVVERSGVWVRISSSPDREGWVDAARVIDLNARPLRN